MKTGVLPGTFNPPTLGHFDIIQRASTLCQRLIVAIVDNPSKKGVLFSLDEKKRLLSMLCKSLPNVEIVGFQGLLVDFAKEQEADFVIRGLRTTNDFEYEEQMAVANRVMTGIDTVFLLTAPAYAHISSTLAREIGSLGRRLHDFVPDQIEKMVYEKIAAKRKESDDL